MVSINGKYGHYASITFVQCKVRMGLSNIHTVLKDIAFLKKNESTEVYNFDNPSFIAKITKIFLYANIIQNN